MTQEDTENKEIPFYLLSELGSDETIRGFSRGRFRDKDALLASAEYRYPIWEDHPNSLDAFIFIDAGQVADFMLEDFKKDNTQFGYGLGFRFYNDEKDDLMGKISFGFSKERFRVVFALDD
jgi:outer membrane protein assembly factor BamA